MKIAQIAPLMESVPPRLYGGTERVVSYLTEAFVAQGHDVTLFASGQSITSARLVPCCAQPLRLNPAVRDPIPYYMLMLDKVRSRPATSTSSTSTSTSSTSRSSATSPIARSRPCTAGRTCPTCRRSIAAFPRCRWCRSRMRSARPIPDATYLATVYHGLPRDLLTPTLRSARRLSGVHRPHLAREARRPRDPHRASGRHSARRLRPRSIASTWTTSSRRSSRC